MILDADDETLYEDGPGGPPHLVRRNVRLRLLTDDEETEALGDPTVQAGIRFVADYHRHHGSPSPYLKPPDGGGPPY